MEAPIHVGLHFAEIKEILKCRNFEQIGNSFTVTENLVFENSTEMLNVKTIDCRSLCWTRSTLAHDQVKIWSKAKVRVYSASVLCLGRMSSSNTEENAKWSSQVNEIKMYCAVGEFLGIDGEAIRNILPGF